VPQAVLQQPKLSLLESETKSASAREVGKTERQTRMRKRRGGVQRGGDEESEKEKEDSCSTSMRKREAWEREA
jgi:hypothetical protein